MATPDPSPTAPSPPQPPSRPKALIVISSARTLPLAQPSGHPGISIGFFLVELAKVLQGFGDDYDLVFATPDGRPPQLDINGMALSFHAVPGLGPATARAAVAQATRFDADTFRQRRPQLVARRDAQLATAYQLLGGLPVSQPLPNTDKEAKLIRDDVVRAFAALPEHPYHSAREKVETATNPAAVRLVYDEKANLLTGNGPQAIDDQAARLRQLLDGAT